MSSNFVLMHVHHLSYTDIMLMDCWYRELYLMQLQQWETDRQRLQAQQNAQRSS